MPARINKAIELLEQGQPVYYIGVHEVSFEAGRELARTWADYINVSMEHGTFDLKGLEDFMRGLVAGGPTASGHRTPTVIVDLPAEGSSEAVIRANGWMFKQALDRGVQGILLCHAEDPEAVRALVETCRYPFHAAREAPCAPRGSRGVGGHVMAAPIWGISPHQYLHRANVWPLNPQGELLIGIKIENKRALDRVEETTRVPGVAFAEWGPGDMHMSFGIERATEPFAEELLAVRRRVFSACRETGLFFLDGTSKENVIQFIDEGVRILSGQCGEEGARIGRAYTRRSMAVD